MARNVATLALMGTALLAAVVANQDSALTYVYTETPRYDAKAWTTGADRFPSGAKLVLVTPANRRPVAPDFFASADAAVSYDASHILFSGKRTQTDHWQIYEVALTGGTPRQWTTAPSDCLRPQYLPDGRIVYTRVTRAGAFLEVSGPTPVRLTYGPARVLTADVLRDGRILFEAAATPTGPRELYVVYPDGTGVESMRCDHTADRSEARQISTGDVIFRTGDHLAKFTAALAKQSPVGTLEATGAIAEVTPNTWIVTGKRGLFLYDLTTRAAKDLDAQAVQPVVVATRTPPRRFPTALVPTRTTGNLLCLDVRIAKPALDGDIRKVRFFTQTQTLGEAPVEKDGSFYVQLPADQPLRMELVDAAGKVARAEHGWFWMKPSEQRVCVGCHAGPERTSENKVPAVLLRTTIPTNLTGTTTKQGK